MGRINHRERELYLFGLTLKRAIDDLASSESTAAFEHWQWLVSLMERTAAARADTQEIESRIRFVLNDPRIPF